MSKKPKKKGLDTVEIIRLVIEAVSAIAAIITAIKS